MDKMRLDKKNSGSTYKVVMLQTIGSCIPHSVAVETDDLFHVLSPFVMVSPTGPAKGDILVPGSKSLSNRVLLMAALGTGTW